MRNRLVPLLAVLLLAAGCSGLTYRTQGIDRATGADAAIHARVDERSRVTRFSIEAENLPPPGRLEDDATEFVVWARSIDGESWRRLGSLDYDAKSRKGTLKEASAPETEFELVITPERKATPAMPSGTPVLRQVVGR